MKVAIYVRVSTADQDYYNQLVALRLYAEKEGWEIFEEYCDVISGSKDTRPKWDLMFQHASRRLFDVVLFVIKILKVLVVIALLILMKQYFYVVTMHRS